MIPAGLLAGLLLSGTAFARPGDYDPSFRHGGRAYSGLSEAIVVQPDGRLLVNEHDAIDRYLADGTPDPTFDSQFEEMPIAGLVDDLAVQPDGKILVVTNGEALHGSLVRLLADGSLDPDFGAGGVAADAPVAMRFQRVVLQSDGAIVVTGGAGSTLANRDLAVARYAATGALDTSFGTGGVVVTDVSSGTSSVDHVALQSDGKIIGYGRPHTVARWDAAGVLDASFGTGGIVDVGTANEGGLVVQPDDAIVVTYGSGVAGGGTTRLLADGALDPSFGTGGTAGARGTEIVLQPDGKLVLSRTPFVRLLADGTVDPSFAGDVAQGVHTVGRCTDVDDHGRLVCASAFGIVRVLGGTCGDSVVDAGEDCDDGNVVDGDSCDAHCCTVDTDGDGRCDAIDPCTGGSAFVKTGVKLQQRGVGERMIVKGQAPIPAPASPPLDPAANGVRLRIDGARGNLLDVTIPGGAGWTVAGVPGRQKWTWDVDDAGVIRFIAGLERIKLQDMTSRALPTVKFDIQAYDDDYDPVVRLDPFRDAANQPISISLVFDTPTATTGQCGTASFPGRPGPECRLTQAAKLTCK